MTTNVQCLAMERHFTVKEVAEMWGISQDLVRDVFRGEPGVLRIERPETRKKRGYATIRVPQTVMESVHRRLTKGRAA